MKNKGSIFYPIYVIGLATAISSFAPPAHSLSTPLESVGQNGLQKNVFSAKSLSSFDPIVVQGSWKAGANLEGKPCNIGGIEYADGVGVDAHSELKYSLDGHFRFFQAWVGLDLAQKGGMVRFQVFTDGQLAFDTGSVRHGRQGMNPHRAIGCRVPLAGIHELKLQVTGDGGINADWADARLWETDISLPDPARFSNPLRLASAPPMGWNSWCGYGTGVNDAVVRRNADGMISSGMKDAGYQYVIIDDWWALRARDQGGNLVPDQQKFPQGIKALADYVHSKGLKFGMYTDAKAKTCGGFPGSYGHYEQDAALFAKWGVDFLKVDWNGGGDPAPAAKLYADFGAALAKERILFNICEWGKDRPWSWARQAGGQMWRTTYDLIDRWNTEDDSNFGNGILLIADQNECLGAFAGPGGWNDLDQLFAGLNGQSCQNGVWKKNSEPKCPGCSETEYRTQMSLWCLLSAPLIAGCDLTVMDSATMKTLTNREVISVDQDPLGIPAWRAQKVGLLEVWQKPLANGDFVVGLFNRGDNPQTVTVWWKCLGIADARIIRDLWSGKGLGIFNDRFAREVVSHEVVLLRLSKPSESSR